MILKKSLILVVVSLFSSTLLLQAEDGNNLTNLSLERALSIMEQNNLELKISKFNEQITAHEANIAKGNNYGKLDLKMQALRSNDAGNVFGFKLKVEKPVLVILDLMNLICQDKPIHYLFNPKI